MREARLQAVEMSDDETAARLSGTPIHSAMIECPTCGVETQHRILRIDPRAHWSDGNRASVESRGVGSVG